MAGNLSVDRIWKMDTESRIIKHLSTIFRRLCEAHANRFCGAHNKT